MSDSLESAVEGFLAHKRALGRKYDSEQHELRLLVRFASERRISCLTDFTPALLEDFLASRPRSRPRSFNHLLGAVRGLLDWAVTHELVCSSPLQARPRRVSSARVPFLFDVSQARRLLDAAAALPTTRGHAGEAPPTGRSSRSATGSGCAPGRPAGSASATSTPAGSCLWCGAASSARAAWSRTGRGSPRWSARRWSAARQPA